MGFCVKLLNPMIEGIDDVEAPQAVDRNAVRRIKLAGLCPFFAKACPIRSFFRKLLDFSANGIRPKVSVGIQCDARRSLHIPLAECRKIAAEFSGRDLVIAPGHPELSFWCEFLHSTECNLGGEEVARFVQGQKGGAGKKRLRMRVAAEFPFPEALSTPLGQELSLRIKDLNAAIALVGDVDAPVLTDGDSTGHIELPGAGPELSPFTQQFPFGAVDGNLVPLPWFLIP